MDTKGLQKEFINWCKSKNKSPKSEDETKLLFVAFMKEKHPEEYKQAMLKQQSQTQKALHGAKLNYFKSLKNQCAEDEEIVYYKKGGSVGCGCKKKENGGEVPSAKKGSAVEKFKAMKMQKAGKVRTKAELDRINRQSEEDAINGTYGMSQKLINKFNNPKVTKETYNSMDGDPHGNKIQRVITHRLNKEDNDTTYNRTPHSQYGDNRLRFSSSNYGDRKQYKKDEESFNRAKSYSVSKKACGSKIKKHQEGSVIAQFKAYRKGGNIQFTL